MTSFRRRAIDIEASLEDYDSKPPKALREYLDILDKVAKVGIEGYTDVHITIRGRQEELSDLADELETWKPATGWSQDAQKLFEALRAGER